MRNIVQKSYITLVLLLVAVGTHGQEDKADNAGYHYGQAMQAYQEKDYALYLSSLSQLVEPDTRQPVLLYQISAAHALNGNYQQAATYLRKLADMGLAYPISTDADFVGFRKSEHYVPAVKAFESNTNRTNSSQLAFILKEKDIIPEGIAYDSRTKTWYVGSIYKRKILSIKANGEVGQFTKEGQDGLYSVLGMKVDEARRVLWVCSAGLYGETHGASGIFEYDLSRGKLIKKYLLNSDSQQNLLNDLVIDRNGDAFVTNSLTGSIYRISKADGQLKEFIKSGTFVYPNGIALSPKGDKLFVADFNGIYAIDIVTKKITELTYPNTTLAGIDGMYFFEDRLIAVQNGVMPPRIISMHPNKNFTDIEKVEILETNHPLFEKLPTTGVVAGEMFYFIANSQLRSIDENGSLLPMDQLQEPVILKLIVR